MRSSLCFLILFLSTITYSLIISVKNTVFADTWPLNNIVFETVLFLLLVLLLSRHVFQTPRASIILMYSIIISMFIYVPLLKYPNNLWLYGPWDSSAHYSFALWISEKGYVPANNELGYSKTYGHHPGNGLLPAILGIISRANPLPISMSIVLWASYTTYALLLMALITSPRSQGIIEYLSVISLLALFTLYPPYYGGVELAYAHVALIAYLIIKTLNLKNQSAMPHKLLIIIAYSGLLVSHFSTAMIIIFFIILTFIGLFALKKYCTLFSMNKKYIDTTIVLGVLFLAYELYVDIYLAGLTLRGSIQRLIDLYIHELEIARHTLEYNPYVSINDLISYLISQYTKNIIIVISIGVYILYRLYIMKKRQTSFCTNEESMIFTLFVFSTPSWLIGWFGVGNFMSGGRALPLIQFFFSISVIRFLNENREYRTHGYIKRFVITLCFIMIFLLGFFSNYSIHIGPYITSLEGDSFTYPVWTQGAISPFVIDSISFLNSFLTEDSAYKFLCVQPYTGFGLCDIMWNKPKIPTNGFIKPRSTTSNAMIELLEKYTNVVIPIPTTDNVLSGPLGYESFYRVPFIHVTLNGKGIIYSNKYYVLAFR